LKIHTTTRKLAVSALVATTLGTTISINAATISPTVGFVTVLDIVLSTEDALTFGQNVVGTSGTTCTMTTDVFAGTGVAASGAAAATEDSITGAGCLTVAQAIGNNFSGVYGITGEDDQAFTVTVGSSTDADFSFTPTAAVCDVTAGCLAAGTVVFADTPQLSAFDSNGDAMVVVAGTITVGGADLTSNTPYSQTFDITATY
jgi:hypothetical protein